MNGTNVVCNVNVLYTRGACGGSDVWTREVPACYVIPDEALTPVAVQYVGSRFYRASHAYLQFSNTSRRQRIYEVGSKAPLNDKCQ